MTKLVKVIDNTENIIPKCPVVTYEVIADFGKFGTRTIYESGSLSEVEALVKAIEDQKLNRIPNIDLYEDEIPEIESIGVNIVLTAERLDIIQYEGETSACAELKSYKFEK